MQSVFGTVVWVVCGVGIVGAVASLLGSRRTWDDYGRDHLVRDSEAPRPASVVSAVAVAERDEEVRQMLEARNARRRRRGEAEVDVERELSRLTAPAGDHAIDDALRGEVRELVIARNHRRARRGEPALDVETEVRRQIANLSQR